MSIKIKCNINNIKVKILSKKIARILIKYKYYNHSHNKLILIFKIVQKILIYQKKIGKNKFWKYLEININKYNNLKIYLIIFI